MRDTASIIFRKKTISRRSLAQLEALNLTSGCLRQFVDELDPARVLVRREARLYVVTQLIRERGGCAMAWLEHDVRQRFHQLFLVGLADHRRLENRRMGDERRFDFDRRNV